MLRITNVNTFRIQSPGKRHRMAAKGDEIAARLQLARKKRGLTRKQVSERLGEGYSVSAIQAHENGRNRLNQENLVVYARTYSVDVPWLLEGLGLGPDKPIPDAIDGQILTKLLDHLLSISDLEMRPGLIAEVAAGAYEELVRRDATAADTKLIQLAADLEARRVLHSAS